MKQYNFILDNKLITVHASSVKEGQILAELTLKEMKSAVSQ